MESVCNAGDLGSIPVLGKFPGEGNGYPFQYSCLENSMDRGVWWATGRGVTESDGNEELSTHTSFYFISLRQTLNEPEEHKTDTNIP